MQTLVKLSVFVLGLLALNACNTLKYSVLYGDRTIPDAEVFLADRFKNGKPGKQVTGHVFRLYFDREGILYPPDCPVPGAFLKANNYTFLLNDSTFSAHVEDRLRFASLIKDPKFKDYASLYKTEMAELNKGHHLTASDEDRIRNFKENFENLHLAKLMERIKDTIDFNGYNNVSFVMVGFNNKLLNAENSFNSSETKLRLLRQEIQSILDSYNLRRDTAKFPDEVKTLFIEVHWDGKYTAKKGIRTGLSYRPALRTSYKVGLTLRKIIDKLDPGIKVQLLSHSSGANIVCEVLFNQISKVKRKGKEQELWRYLDHKYESQKDIYTTPAPERMMTAGLLAPSIPGKLTFADYYKRTNAFKEDKYLTVIGYNLDDVALRKKFGNFLLGPLLNSINAKDYLIKQIEFSSTALGCLKYEVEAVKNLFRKDYASQNIQFVDFTYTKVNGYKAANTIHPVEQYIKTPQYRQFIEAVFQLASAPSI